MGDTSGLGTYGIYTGHPTNEESIKFGQVGKRRLNILKKESDISLTHNAVFLCSPDPAHLCYARHQNLRARLLSAHVFHLTSFYSCLPHSQHIHRRMVVLDNNGDDLSMLADREQLVDRLYRVCDMHTA